MPHLRQGSLQGLEVPGKPNAVTPVHGTEAALVTWLFYHCQARRACESDCTVFLILQSAFSKYTFWRDGWLTESRSKMHGITAL